MNGREQKIINSGLTVRRLKIEEIVCDRSVVHFLWTCKQTGRLYKL